MISSNQRDGWTLIELLAVIVILSLLMGGAVYTCRSPLSGTRVQRDMEQVILRDRTIRSGAIRFRRTDRLHIQNQKSESSSQDKPSEKPLVLSTLTELRTSQDARGESSVDIEIDAAGRSPTYAMKFLDPESGKESWMLIAGGTGQPIFDLSLRDVNVLLGQSKPTIN